MKKLSKSIIIATAVLLLLGTSRIYSAEASESVPLKTDSAVVVRIAEYTNSPTARLLLMKMNSCLKALSDSAPAWQTLETSDDDGASIRAVSTVAQYDIIFTDDEEYIKDLESIGLLGQTTVLFTEEIILAGPEEPKFSDASTLLDMLSIIFKENRLFLTLIKNKYIEQEEHKLWGEAGITSPSENKNYVESGKDEISALMQAGDEGAYILVGAGSFAEYQDAQRIETPLISLSGTKSFRKHYMALVSRESSKNERTKTAEKYMKWLTEKDGRAFINGFELGGITPFKTIDD